MAAPFRMSVHRLKRLVSAVSSEFLDERDIGVVLDPTSPGYEAARPLAAAGAVFDTVTLSGAVVVV
jgi:hypothetical protein